MSERTIAVSDLNLTYRVLADRRARSVQHAFSRALRPPRAARIEALRGVTFDSYRGEALGIMGLNGSGKSTLLRCLAGLLKPSSGSVSAIADPVLLGVGAALLPEMSGRRNIFIGGAALGLHRTVIADRFEEMVDFSGLRDSIDYPIKTYSSGMRARLHFSIASAVTPEILLIDEALTVGDEQFRERSRGRLDEMLAAAGTVVVVSHNFRELRRTCARLLWLEKGRLEMDGSPDEVLEAFKARRRLELES